MSKERRWFFTYYRTSSLLQEVTSMDSDKMGKKGEEMGAGKFSADLGVQECSKPGEFFVLDDNAGPTQKEHIRRLRVGRLDVQAYGPNHTHQTFTFAVKSELSGRRPAMRGAAG
ncbi:hypothetical protein AVEN_7189-1 [Araneus ventricosus]|uniref:Uncharacterized protein n=1 Tax=Araneus ventricosus TaxID=182803 RepID=A0A4Y2RKB8_ARAVE|nr:hypothetical protein AVEN_7189-1 [Araneus ventricosus]